MGIVHFRSSFRCKRADSRGVWCAGALELAGRRGTWRRGPARVGLCGVERSEHAGYTLGQLIRLHPELKKRFVESSRFVRHLKSIHSLYGWAALAMSPFIKLLTVWENTRGTREVSGLMDAHYTWSIRYHFFLGYNHYSKDRRRVHHEVATPIQPALAKEYQMKEKSEP